MFEADGRGRLYIRLGKSRRDRRLAEYVAADIERGVNISRLAKDLLLLLHGVCLWASLKIMRPGAALSAKLKD
jgi:hypothetical protein